MSGDATQDSATRRVRLAPGYAVGVTEAMIAAVVEDFYAAVRRDEDLGPVFARHVTDWDRHLSRLRDFWSSVLLMSGRFKGTPMQAHVEIADMEPALFARWLELWRGTVTRLVPSDAAALFILKAENIARSLQLGIAVSRGGRLSPPACPAPP